MQGKQIYTKKIYIISDSAPKHGTNYNQISLFKKLRTDVYLKFILYYLDISSIQSTNKRNRFKNTCEIYITNCSYSYKGGIFFAVYQIMISKGISWDGTHQKGIRRKTFIHTDLCLTEYITHIYKLKTGLDQLVK